MSSLAPAHQEPSKSLWELAELRRASERTARARHRRCVTWSYTVDGGTAGDERTKSIVMEFDRQGRLASSAAWKDGAEVERAEYSYDTSGNMLKEVDTAGTKKESTAFRLDAEGRVLDGATLEASGKQTESFEWLRTADHRHIEFIKRDAGGALQYRIFYEYSRSFDEADYATATKKGADGLVQQRVEQRHGASGVEGKLVFVDDALVSELRYTRAPNGRIAEVVRLVAGKVESRTVYGFDAFGNILEIRAFDTSNSLTSYARNECELYEESPPLHRP